MSAKIKKHLSKDPILKNAISDLEPLNLDPSSDLFNELVKAIAYQQISYKAADSIYAKFISCVGRVDYLPSDVLLLEHSQLRSSGFSNSKGHYILNIAEFFETNNLYGNNWDNTSDEDILSLLTQIKGVGEWTVQMILMFQLQRPDVFPEKDYGIQMAMKELYQLKEEKTALIKKMRKIAQEWKPYRSFASRYLWNWKRLQTQ